jgi:hypothetical protein
MNKGSDKITEPIIRTERSRRWFSFSLRTVLIFFAVVAALLHFWVIPSERQRRACNRLDEESSIASFWFDKLDQDVVNFESFDVPYHLEVKPYDHYRYNVTGVFISKELEDLDWNAFPKIKELYIYNTRESLLQKQALIEKIVELKITTTNIDANMIAAISQYKNLEKLELIKCGLNCDYEDFLQLAKLSKLKQLRIFSYERWKNHHLEGPDRKRSEKQIESRNHVYDKLKKTIDDVELD